MTLVSSECKVFGYSCSFSATLAGVGQVGRCISDRNEQVGGCTVGS